MFSKKLGLGDLYPNYSKPVPVGIYIGAVDRTVRDPLVKTFPAQCSKSI